MTVVKKNIADVIGSLSRILIPNKEWDDLFMFISVQTQSEQLADKELAMILLSVVIEYFTHVEIETYYPQLNPMIEGYLQSNIPSLQSLSIETVNNLASVPSAVKVLKKYSTLIPLTLNALDLNNEELCHKVFETFNEFVEIKKVLRPHLPLVIEKALLIAANADYGVNLREVTLLFLELIAEKYARALISKHGMNFIDQIIGACFQIASEDPALYEGQEDSPPNEAVSVIYAFACNAPNAKVYPIIEVYLQKFGTSKNPHERAAATIILGFIADSEACLDKIQEKLDPLTNFLIDRMQDDSFEVREAAGEAVGRFAEQVTTDFLDKHQKVLPCLLRVIKDMAVSKHDMAIQKTLFALNEFVQNLDYDIKLYLEDIITLLVSCYIQSPTHTATTKYWALVSLSSTINVAQKRIVPYMHKLLEVFDAIINNKGVNEEQTVKGQSLFCAGRLAASCGHEEFPQQASEVFTQFALECLKCDNKKLELRETGIGYFSDLSVLIKEDMAPIFN